MVEVSAFGWLVHCQLGVARKLVAQTDEPGIPIETPRVILKSSKIKAVERIRTVLIRKRWIIQFRAAVLLPEEETERVLGIAGAPAVAAANAEATVDLVTFRAVRINQFDRRRPFPGDAVPARIR